jgi:NTP pyrophosphatase (non-canonical NTP hydrolase)
MEELYRLAIAKWGKNLQKLMTIEECSELTKALTKEIRQENTSYNNQQVCEEIADLKIMLEQLEIIYDKKTIEGFREEKLDRLKIRLGLK